MKRLWLFGAALGLTCAAATAHETDDPRLFGTNIERLEWQAAEGANPVVLEGETWLGRDLEKFWLKFDLERAEGQLEEFEMQALYSRALAAYWDWQVGLRRAVEPGPAQTWAVLAVQGLAPYFFETEAALFVGEQGAVAAHLALEYDLLFSQRWILSPALEMDFHGQNQPANGSGSGLAKIALGWRLRWEIRPELAPYVGVQWQKKYGRSADFARAAGDSAEQGVAVLGARFWF